jgi:hypothetical protein
LSSPAGWNGIQGSGSGRLTAAATRRATSSVRTTPRPLDRTRTPPSNHRQLCYGGPRWTPSSTPSNCVAWWRSWARARLHPPLLGHGRVLSSQRTRPRSLVPHVGLCGGGRWFLTTHSRRIAGSTCHRMQRLGACCHHHGEQAPSAPANTHPRRSVGHPTTGSPNTYPQSIPQDSSGLPR